VWYAKSAVVLLGTVRVRYLKGIIMEIICCKKIYVCNTVCIDALFFPLLLAIDTLVPSRNTGSGDTSHPVSLISVMTVVNVIPVQSVRKERQSTHLFLVIVVRLKVVQNILRQTRGRYGITCTVIPCYLRGLDFMDPCK
jgi:hypothetical protein